MVRCICFPGPDDSLCSNAAFEVQTMFWYFRKNLEKEFRAAISTMLLINLSPIIWVAGVKRPGTRDNQVLGRTHTPRTSCRRLVDLRLTRAMMAWPGRRTTPVTAGLSTVLTAAVWD